MKSIALLATALFLASAPSPDSDVISELSAGFLLSNNQQALMAAEPQQNIAQVQADFHISTALASDTPVGE
ncbi:MAG: hypothetical protein BMS9Abin30_0609 [Gammaproteobacteria bacterium]|nr:MAG: hypothetical protein BMS9Abin30_0609 [Gammaproteobacteria bacterium]